MADRMEIENVWNEIQSYSAQGMRAVNGGQ